MSKIKALFLLICAGVVLLLAVIFFSRGNPIEVQMPKVTVAMVEDYQSKIKAAQNKKQDAAAARKRAELEVRMYQCTHNDDCIIVDQDPCGCLKGPEGVTAINAAFSLEFSRLMQEGTSGSTVCPSVGSTERECSASARPACVQNRCKILY